MCKGGGGTVCGCVCWRKGCVPAAGCVAERGGERSFHSLRDAALRLLQVRDERLKVKERNRNRPLRSAPLALLSTLPPSQRGRCSPFPTFGRLPVAFSLSRNFT